VAFSDQHEQVLSALASHVATAVPNARLYEQLRRNERRLELDLATARDIQNGLMPRCGPRVRGLDIGTAYQPATGIGGDFFDFLPYGDGRLAVAVADVAGKGTPAALYGSLAVGILRGQVVERVLEPAEMLQRLNDLLRRQSIENRFVAMAFGVFDAGDQDLQLANAGFTRPIRLRGGKTESIDVRGIPLGLFPAIRYESRRFKLRPGDVWVFCSDGLQEAVNGVGEQFGGDDLEDILRSLADANAQQIAEGVLRASTAYAGGDYEEHPDDRSVVVVKVRAS
jgi:sigma-B regulation protein RsbU (phosphoserine phosphatase)